MRRRRLACCAVIVTGSVVVSSCGFVQAVETDRFGFNCDQLTVLIDDMHASRARGEAVALWVARHDVACMDRDVESWDAALGELHARRASSIVRDAPIGSLTGTWVGTFTAGYGSSHDSRVVQALLLGLGTPLCLPFDLLVVPTSFMASWVDDLGVSRAAHERALDDLERSRSLGYPHPERWMR